MGGGIRSQMILQSESLKACPRIHGDLQVSNAPKVPLFFSLHYIHVLEVKETERGFEASYSRVFPCLNGGNKRQVAGLAPERQKGKGEAFLKHLSPESKGPMPAHVWHLLKHGERVGIVYPSHNAILGSACTFTWCGLLTIYAQTKTRSSLVGRTVYTSQSRVTDLSCGTGCQQKR